ncbi:MAG: YgdI/YgdR family lipoprotein [Pseudomonas sp.]|jgi:major membrane immunogen (membrane-anchored lipoprotein)|nr:YgdI/YgdR family lipoprotein [Pseudomonas sp.]MDD2223016.1 YgdI/YgdR family lipoprotein [Pseudomonas sp.]MDY0414977.1 YgdI/YgdR family lipoprotein [Pseudomonas sp.]NLO53200.1 YgdI/YgdR family lipoprotein [Gammaproteobacteria bacterium]
MSKKYLTALFVAAALVTLAGCASPTVITLKNGVQLETTDEPKYNEDSGFYEFTQKDGKPVSINKDDIHTIKKN